MKVLAVLFAASLAAGSAAAETAQTPAPAPAAPPPASSEPYTYDPAGRRDPFINLLGSGTEARTARKGDGVTSLQVDDVSVRGVMQSRGALVAMIQGSDHKTYIVHAGDHFADGVIKTITPQGLVVLQDVNDPLSLVKQREVRKSLRSAGDAKQ